MTLNETIWKIESQLRKPLPGRRAHAAMAHFNRTYYPDAPEDAKIACVLLLLYPKNNQTHFVLIQRMSTNKNDRHSGQISFPGGKLDPTDLTLLDGALREAEEEVGINRKDVKNLGSLSDLYIDVSNFQVFPFIGALDYTPKFVPQPTEVQSIIEVPLSLLQDPATLQTTDIKFGNGMTIKNAPYFNIHGHVVWGATAMMLNEFLEVLKK